MASARLEQCTGRTCGGCTSCKEYEVEAFVTDAYVTFHNGKPATIPIVDADPVAGTPEIRIPAIATTREVGKQIADFVGGEMKLCTLTIYPQRDLSEEPRIVVPGLVGPGRALK